VQPDGTEVPGRIYSDVNDPTNTVFVADNAWSGGHAIVNKAHVDPQTSNLVLGATVRCREVPPENCEQDGGEEPD